MWFACFLIGARLSPHVCFRALGFSVPGVMGCAQVSAWGQRVMGRAVAVVTRVLSEIVFFGEKKTCCEPAWASCTY